MGTAIVGAAMIGGSVLGAAAPASAHNYMIASTPPVGGTLTSLPKTFEITTNDKLLDLDSANSGFAYRIVGPDGRYYENGCLHVDGPSMTTKAALGASGRYTVEWQIVSADGHTVSDDYTFTWDAPASFTPARGATSPPACAASGSTPAMAATSGAVPSGSDSGADVASNAIWIGSGGLVLVAMVVVVLLLLRRPASRTDDEHDDGSLDDARD